MYCYSHNAIYFGFHAITKARTIATHCTLVTLLRDSNEVDNFTGIFIFCMVEGLF